MTLIELLVLLVIAAITGGIGASIAGRTSLGCLASAAVGYIGAILGVWLARQMDLPVLWTVSVGGEAFPIIWSIVGSALFVAVISLISGRR